MCENSRNLFVKVLSNEISTDFFVKWLRDGNTNGFPQLEADTRCSRADFMAYFINYIHEELPKCVETEIQVNNGEVKFQEPISSPDISPIRSTPNGAPHNNSYLSPISPLYKVNHHSFSTPKNKKNSLTPKSSSPVCFTLGDFIANPKRQTGKRRPLQSEVKRRINPTNCAKVNNGFSKLENRFNFSNDFEELSCDNPMDTRNILAEERITVLARKSEIPTDLPFTVPKPKTINSSPVRPILKHVRQRASVDKCTQIYFTILESKFIVHVINEVHFLIKLLQLEQFGMIESGSTVLPDNLFKSIQNVWYFAANALKGLVNVLRNCDKTMIRILADHEVLRKLAPDLSRNLQKYSDNKGERLLEPTAIGSSNQENVCFNSDTDNRLNFPSDASFHAFRKQRDLFYEILRLWEAHHLSSGFNFSVTFGGKIKSLLSLCNEPSNFVHFTRLFKAQLLSSCRNYRPEGDTNESTNSGLMSALPIDAEKLNRLTNRLVTKGADKGVAALPHFAEREEFYRDFILVAGNHCFNQHLCDALISEIKELNDTNFNFGELHDKDSCIVDPSTRQTFHACVKSLRLLAKFLGFIESLPYKSDYGATSELLLNSQITLREKTHPSFDVIQILQSSIEKSTVVLSIPWLCKYLAMLDYVALRLPYYKALSRILFEIFHNFEMVPESNAFFVKCCLGWLFELPYFPVNDYYSFWSGSISGNSGVPSVSLKVPGANCLDGAEIVDQTILHFCCPYLDELKKTLTSKSSGHNNVTVKHITPVTALQSPDEVAKKKLQQQLEEAFFNGQPVSLRKTVDFVSDRVASSCVKYICGCVVPPFKKEAAQKLRAIISNEPESFAEKDQAKIRSDQLAADCLKELRLLCATRTNEICDEKIPNAIDSLVGIDILPQTRTVCEQIARRTCWERVQIWIDNQVTANVFAKDFDERMSKLFPNNLSRGPKQEKPVFLLPPGGSDISHDDSVTSAVHLLENLQELSVQVVEGSSNLTLPSFQLLLSEIQWTVSERNDVNECIVATICTLLLDLVLLLFTRNTALMVDQVVKQKLIDIWVLYYKGCDNMLKTLLCPRNVKMFLESASPENSWAELAHFCVFLINKNVLSCESFESQCTGLFRSEWDQTSLKYISSFFKVFVQVYRAKGGRTDAFALLLDFLSDYCEDLL